MLLPCVLALCAKRMVHDSRCMTLCVTIVHDCSCQPAAHFDCGMAPAGAHVWVATADEDAAAAWAAMGRGEAAAGKETEQNGAAGANGTA